MLASMRALTGQRHLLYEKRRVVPFSGWRLMSSEAVERLEEEGSRDVRSCKRELLRNEGFTDSQIDVVLNHDLRSDKLLLLLTVLKDHGISGKAAGSLITSGTYFLHGVRSVCFCQRVQILEEAGFNPARLKAAMLKPSAFFFLPSTPENVQMRISYLRGMGLSSDDSCSVLIDQPRVINMSFETRLKYRCELLREIGFSRHGYLWMFRHGSAFFWISKDALLQKLQFIKELNMEWKTRSALRALALWVRYPVANLRAKIDCLSSLGISHEHALQVVKQQPGVICLSQEHVTHKFEFLLHTMKLESKDILKITSSLICSLENRLIPRFAIVEDLKAKGLLSRPVSARNLFSLTDERFATKFNVDKNLQHLYAAQSRLFTLKGG